MKKEVNALSLFDRNHDISVALNNHGFNSVAIDIMQPKFPQSEFVCDNVHNWRNWPLHQGQIKFIFAAIPCEAFSIACGNFHFKKGIPQTKQAVESLRLLFTIHEIINHFKCLFIFENPSGAVARNPTFNILFNYSLCRTSLGCFGYPTKKPTDLICSPEIVLILPQQYRVKGKFQKQKFDNLTYSKRIKYPENFAEMIAFCAASYIGLSSTPRTQILQNTTL